MVPGEFEAVVSEIGELEPDWRREVQVREDPTLAAEVDARRSASLPARTVGVTDLLALRRAFWRLTGPRPEISAERRARLDSGRFFHRAVERVLAPDGAIEVRVRRDGLVGRVDAVTDRPIEVKTATFAVEGPDLLTDRPEQVEQLGMYCALLGRPVGRLVTLVTHGEAVEEVRTLDLSFRELPELLAEMVDRARSLRASLDAGRPDGLPRCRWYGRGCEYQSGPLCDCSGEEPLPSSAFLDNVGRVDPRPEHAAELFGRVRGALRSMRPPTIARFRDMMYPRRAYFERVRPEPEAAEAAEPLPPAGREAYRQLIDAVERGPVGEVTRLPSLSDEPEEEVGGFRGDPFLLKTSGARVPLTAEQLLARAPQYALELGFRCAATGRTAGRVFVAYERSARGNSEIKVFELKFASVSAFARLWRQRQSAFGVAVRDGAPNALPPCPDWMYRDCPYRDECACGSDPGRSQR